MNKQDLIKELTEFINSDGVEEIDGEVDIESAGIAIEGFLENLGASEDEEDADETLDEGATE